MSLTCPRAPLSGCCGCSSHTSAAAPGLPAGTAAAVPRAAASGWYVAPGLASSAIAAAASAAVMVSALMARTLLPSLQATLAWPSHDGYPAGCEACVKPGKEDSHEALLSDRRLLTGRKHRAARSGTEVRSGQGRPADETGGRRPGFQRGESQGIRARDHAG